MFGWRILLWAVLVLAALGFLYLVRAILPPFIVAFVIASLLEPSIRKLQKRGIGRKRAVVSISVLFFVSVAAIGVIAGPHILDQVKSASDRVGELTATLTKTDPSENFFLSWNPVVQARHQDEPGAIDKLLSPFRAPLAKFGLPTSQREIVSRFVEPNRDEISGIIQRGFEAFAGILGTLPHQILNLILIPILVIMMLMDMENMRQRPSAWIPPALRPAAMRLLRDIGDVFTRYLRGVTTVVLAFSVAVTLLLWFFNVPYAILLGIVFGALYMIPYIGNMIAYVVVFFVVALSGTTGNFLFDVSSPWLYGLIATLGFAALAFLFDVRLRAGWAAGLARDHASTRRRAATRSG